MGSRFVLSLGTAVALATAFAPRAEAQVARNPVTVCRNGARINSEDSHACDRNGGIDLKQSAIARRTRTSRNRSRRWLIAVACMLGRFSAGNSRLTTLPAFSAGKS